MLQPSERAIHILHKRRTGHNPYSREGERNPSMRLELDKQTADRAFEDRERNSL
jgi:hypothetical protein